MDNLNLATREIFWNIPPSYKAIMYALFLLALAVFVKGFYTKMRFVTHTGGFPWPRDLFQGPLNWKAFFKTLLFMGKTAGHGRVAFFHALIYYGFIILWIATDLVAIHADTPFKIYKGPVYIIISFLSDIAAITILVGIALAYRRRYGERPDYLASSHPKGELFMYGMLIVLVLVGLLLEGIRIYGTGMPAGEAFWSPVGWMIAGAVGLLPLSDEAMGASYRFLWMFHMINTMAFIAVIPYSKFSHIVLIPLSALITPSRRGGVLSPMDFEDESAESFGLGKFSEMTAKNRFDLLTCVECGRCSQVCPALLSGKNLDPKTVVTKARDAAFTATSKGDDLSFWEEKIYAEGELDACTTCGACMDECPSNIEHIPLIMELKRYKALTMGSLPPAAAAAIEKIKINGNPWGISEDDRFEWASGIDVPVIEPEKKVDYLYYVGCAGSYDKANGQVVKDTITLLKKAGVDFAVIGKTEKCNGDPIRRFGDEYTFHEMAVENIAGLNKYSFDKIVTHCPHCLHTIGKEYAKFKDGQFETIHHTELLASLIREGKLRAEKEIDETMTFHDPCYLGRHHGEYDAPRKILQSIPKMKLKEMESSREKAVCCGMGGGNMWYELPEGEHLSKRRLAHVAETKSSKLATSCSYCMINFNSSKNLNPNTEGMEVEDVASIFLKATL